MKLALALVCTALVAPVKAESESVCQDHWQDCGRGDFPNDVCRTMGEQEHDEGLVTKWQNITCLADEYVTCSRVEFGALNGHNLRVIVRYGQLAITPRVKHEPNPHDTMPAPMNSRFYYDPDTTCYQLNTSRGVYDEWPGAIYPNRETDHPGGQSLNASEALSAVKFEVECNDIGQDDYDDSIAGFCEYTAFLRCDCRRRPGPHTTPLPPVNGDSQCSNMLRQSQCGTQEHDVCNATRTQKPTHFQVSCPPNQVVEIERLQFWSTSGLIDVEATGVGNLSDLIGGQNLPCLVACSPDADDKQCLSYPPPSDLSGRDKLGHLSFINFVVSCASDSCAYETFLRYNCIEAPTYDDDSDVSTQHPTATPPPPAKRGGKKTSASVTLLSVTFVILLILGAVVLYMVYHKRNGYMRHGEAADEGTISMSGFDLDDDPALRLGTRRPETNIVITGTDDDAVWRPDPVTGKPTRGPGTTPQSTPQTNRKAVGTPGSMPRRFDPQTGAPLDESMPPPPLPTPLQLWPGGTQANDGHVGGVVGAGADDALLITLNDDAEASSPAVGAAAGHLDASLFGTPASDRFFTPMESAPPTPFATPGATPFASPFATPGQPPPASTPNRRFDPKTGQPLVSDATPPVAGSLPRRFDPKTGQVLGASSPLVEMAGPAVGADLTLRFNPQTGQPC